MRLALIAVSEPNKYPQFLRRFLHTDNLVLPLLAALTPPGIRVRLIDESVRTRKPDYRRLEADLAAISVRTSCADRAYELSGQLRAQGIRTVLGGIHPTILPEEGKRHADAIVIGEAEPVWHRLLEDFRGGRLQPYYRGGDVPDLSGLPLPRRDLLRFPDRSLLGIPTIQAGRGCPHSCSYCLVTRIYGGRHRKRPVDDVIRELEAMDAARGFATRLLPPPFGRILIFLDDNLLADRDYARELLLRLRPLRRRWYTQASVAVAQDPELLRLAWEAGCRMLAVGFESVVQESLTGVRKSFNRTAEYREAVGRIRRAGILVGASFMLGFDGDDTGVFGRTLQFAVDAGVDLASFHILTPYPGTPFYDQVVREARLLEPPGSWRKFDTQHVVFRPKRMSPAELQEGVQWLWREFSSLRSIRRRARNTPVKAFFWPPNLFLHALFASSMIRMTKPAGSFPGGPGVAGGEEGPPA